MLAGAAILLLLLRRGVVPTLLSASAVGVINGLAGGPVPTDATRRPRLAGRIGPCGSGGYGRHAWLDQRGRVAEAAVAAISAAT